MYKKGEAKLFLDILGYNYKILVTDNLADQVREIANRGFDGLRIFNCDKDEMSYEDYSPEYFKKKNERLKYLPDRNLFPIDSFGGFWRKNHRNLTQKQWETVWLRSLENDRKIFPDDKFVIEHANEPKVGQVPRDFGIKQRFGNTWKYYPRKNKNIFYQEVNLVKVDPITKKRTPDFWTIGPQAEVRRLGGWHWRMTELLVNEEFPKGNLMGDCSMEGYPATGEFVPTGMSGELFDDRKYYDELKEIITSWHNIMLAPKDVEFYLAKLYVARRLWKYFASNDGGSMFHKCYGPGVWADRNKARGPDYNELYTTAKYLFEIAKNGIKGHQVSIWLSDLPRLYFRYDEGNDGSKGPDCLDMAYLDWDRLNAMPEAHNDVFGKYPKNYGKHPKPNLPPEPEPEKPKPEITLQCKLCDYYNDEKIICQYSDWKSHTEQSCPYFRKREITKEEEKMNPFKSIFAWGTMWKYLRPVWNLKIHYIAIHLLCIIIGIILGIILF